MPRRIPKEFDLSAQEKGLTPVDYMLRVMRCPDVDMKLRLDAAKSAAQYLHPKPDPVYYTYPEPPPLEMPDKWENMQVKEKNENLLDRALDLRMQILAAPLPEGNTAADEAKKRLMLDAADSIINQALKAGELRQKGRNDETIRYLLTQIPGDRQQSMGRDTERRGPEGLNGHPAESEMAGEAHEGRDSKELP